MYLTRMKVVNTSITSLIAATMSYEEHNSTTHSARQTRTIGKIGNGELLKLDWGAPILSWTWWQRGKLLANEFQAYAEGTRSPLATAEPVQVGYSVTLTLDEWYRGKTMTLHQG